MDSLQRVVIITGASRGIGAGLVAGYRGLGFRVVATSRSIAPSSDEHVLAIGGDIRDRATAKKVVAAATLAHAVWPSSARTPSRVRRFVDLLVQRLKKEVI